MHLHHRCGSPFKPCQNHVLEVLCQTLKAKSSPTAASSSSMITKRHSCSGFPWPQASNNHWGPGHATIHTMSKHQWVVRRVRKTAEPDQAPASHPHKHQSSFHVDACNTMTDRRPARFRHPFRASHDQYRPPVTIVRPES